MLDFVRPSSLFGLLTKGFLFACAATAFPACGEAERAPGIDSGFAGGGAGQSCKLGEERRCSETLEQSNGISTCYWGTQTCSEGGWSTCRNGRSFRVPSRESTFDVKPLSISGAPTSCDNDCDPTCQHWAEPGNLTGSLDSSLPDFPGMTGGASTCAHELCSPGVALDPTCDTCAATVCAEDSTCCGAMGGTWDDVCVDLVYELCLSQTRPRSLCDYGLYSSSTNQVTITSLAQQSDISIGGLGNITISGGRSVERIVTGGPVYLSSDTFPPSGVLAEGRITLNGSSSYQPIGPLESGSNIEMYTYPVVQGDVYAQGNIVWEANVYGDVVSSMGTVSFSGGCAASVFGGGSCIDNNMHAAPVLMLPSIPAQTFTCGGSPINVGGDHTLTPGNYGDVVVDGMLTLNGAGTYNFNRLYARGIKLVNGGALVNVEVCNEFNMLTNAQVVDATDALLTDPSQLFVNVQGNLHFDSNVDWVGVILAGSSGTKAGGSIHGAIWASPVNDINNQDYIVGLDRDDCVDMGIPGTAPPACPIVGTGTSVPPALNEPCGSGLDCQINHRCEEPVTDVACAHSKCGAGGALDATCDSCVAAICAVDASCCSTEWTSACVDRVATVCDAVCATDGGTCNAAICTSPADGTSICDFSVSAAGSVDVSALSSVSPRPQVAGNIGSAGALALNWADVSGDVWVGGAFAETSATRGTLTVASPSVFSSRFFSCSAADGTPSSGSIAPGDYGAVVVPAGQTLTLTEGNYTFTSLVLSDESAGMPATLELPATGKVTVEVCGTPISVVIGTGAQITGLTAATALQFDLYATGDVVVNAGAVTYGFLQSATDVTLTDATHYGFVSSGDTVSLVGDTDLQGTSLRAACLMGGYDPGNDPAVLGPPTESGTCTPNAGGYEDATCSGFDLALGVPCDDQVSVCNHGTSTYSGSVTIGAYDSLTPTMSDPAPPAPTSSCSASVNIAPGTCQTITCAGIPAGVTTLMLDPGDLIDECGADERRWDNWSVHDGRSCMGTNTHEHDYVATCSSSGTAPAWGLLTYEAVIPGASSIEFWGRVGVGRTDADAAADAASQTYTLLLTADNTLESCQEGGPLPCPLDLTEILSLENAQGHHLDLRIVLNGSGGDDPQLTEWDITYSCIYDE